MFGLSGFQTSDYVLSHVFFGILAGLGFFVLMASWLESGLGGPDSSTGRAAALFSWQGTLLSQCLSSPRCIKGYWRIYCWGNLAMD